MRLSYIVVAFVACVVYSSVAAGEPEAVLTDAALQQILQQRINGKKAVGLVVGGLQGTNRSIVAAGTMALTNSRPVDGDTATSSLKRAGVSDSIARDIIGHESVAVSQNYTHIDDATKRESLDKLPDLTA